jgi:hypothetical protein
MNRDLHQLAEDRASKRKHQNSNPARASGHSYHCQASHTMAAMSVTPTKRAPIAQPKLWTDEVRDADGCLRGVDRIIGYSFGCRYSQRLRRDTVAKVF